MLFGFDHRSLISYENRALATPTKKPSKCPTLIWQLLPWSIIPYTLVWLSGTYRVNMSRKTRILSKSLKIFSHISMRSTQAMPNEFWPRDALLESSSKKRQKWKRQSLRRAIRQPSRCTPRLSIRQWSKKISTVTFFRWTARIPKSFLTPQQKETHMKWF